MGGLATGETLLSAFFTDTKRLYGEARQNLALDVKRGRRTSWASSPHSPPSKLEHDVSDSHQRRKVNSQIGLNIIENVEPLATLATSLAGNVPHNNDKTYSSVAGNMSTTAVDRLGPWNSESKGGEGDESESRLENHYEVESR